MDLFEALFSRRSVRSYTAEPVSPADREVLLRAAMAAPSAGNAQPWRFVLLDDPDVLAKIPGISPYAHMAAKAPLAILVCGDTQAEKYPGFWPQDCSAAVQNMLLAAVGLGLGAVWCGIHPDREREKKFMELAGLPGHVIPLGLVVVGHPEAAPGPADRYDPAKVRHNFW